jgi:hypothetical protein
MSYNGLILLSKSYLQMGKKWGGSIFCHLSPLFTFFPLAFNPFDILIEK